MTDKERLEKIKEIDISPLCFYLNEMTNFDGKLLKGYWKWLIKQAERVEELEKELDKICVKIIEMLESSDIVSIKVKPITTDPEGGRRTWLSSLFLKLTTLKRFVTKVS